MSANGHTGRRAKLAAEAAVLHSLGMPYQEIADALAISRSYAAELVDDPTGIKSVERKRRYQGTCIDCGGPTDGSNGRPGAPKRCANCSCAHQSSVEGRRAVTYWTPELLIARIQEWVDLYGEPPAIPDWNPYTARATLNDEERARRFEDAHGHWPHFTSVVDRFGTWNDGIEAAGFPGRDPYGSLENMKRMRSVRAKAAT